MNLNTRFKAVGILTSIVSLFFWGGFLLNNPYKAQGGSEIGLAIIGLMMLFSILAGWAAWKGKVMWLTIAFVGSFFPVGLYVLGTPEIWRWIGLMNLLYVVSAIGIYRSKGKAAGDT